MLVLAPPQVGVVALRVGKEGVVLAGLNNTPAVQNLPMK
jgi:hypothetical protein